MINIKRLLVSISAVIAAGIAPTIAAQGDEEESTRREIVEIMITAEKRQSTVSDTSISITAFDADMLQDLGIQSADELINYIPATTRDQYDIRIRGVGRNYRALGGDPGVATYYNGVYSPDFGIASSESALYDLERVEVLRGPQGTLYGRNSIGGALNYVTKRPTFEWEGQFRSQLGAYGTREFYGVISGPIIEDKLAVRLVLTDRERDGSTKGLFGSPDINTINDTNNALALTWVVTDDITWNVRFNDRESDRLMGRPVLINEGIGADRGTPSTNLPVLGLRRVDAGTPGAMPFTNPLTNEVLYGAYLRPGLDFSNWPYQPNAAYQNPAYALQASRDTDDPNDVSLANADSECERFPHTTCNNNNEFFGHRAVQSELSWDINDTTQLRYIFGYTDFEYTFNNDLDYSDADFSKYRQTVLEDVWNYSHELQLDWSWGDRFTATSGAYLFTETRLQDYSLSNTTNRYTQPFDYGALLPWVEWAGAQKELGDASQVDGFGVNGVYKTHLGLWEGNPRGDVYHHANRIHNKAAAFYSQGTYEINDEFALVLGVRWAEDKRDAYENRNLYFEQVVGEGGFMDFILAPQDWCAGYNALECFTESWGGLPAAGLTPLGAMNAIWGTATLTGDPNNPIAPVCAITDASCTNPLRLGGIPFNQQSETAGSNSWSDVNYRINLDWTPTDDILMYFSVTTAYRAGGYSLGVTDARDVPRGSDGIPTGTSSDIGSPFDYDKEEVTSLEIGYKGFHLDRTLQINASIYRYNYTNYQDRLDVFDVNRNRAVNIVQNAPEAVNQGFEIDFFWLPGDNWTVGGNYSYTDAYYSADYLLVIQNDPNLPTAIFGNPTESPELFVVNAKGNPLKGIPEQKAVIWGAYALDTQIGRFDFRGTYAYTGDFFSSGLRLSGVNEIPARKRIDLSVSWRSNDQSLGARLFVDNVTDEQNIYTILNGGEGSNWRQAGIMLYPRYWGVDLTYNFNL